MPPSRINGLRIFSEVTGSVGEPMVLVHGSWGDSRNWDSVLLTVGGQSPPFFRLAVERIGTAIPHAMTHTYAGAGHVPHLSHPEEYVRVVAGFSEGDPNGG